jgi:uncharacterized protein YprB with RNaseH-like and TPR domain
VDSAPSPVSIAKRAAETEPAESTLASAIRQSDLPGEEVVTRWGCHWRWRQSIETVWPASSRYLSALGDGPTAQYDSLNSHEPCDRDLKTLRQCFPRQTVCLDLETCGFAGSMVFLIGLLHWDQQQLVLTQLWARSYAEEKAILQSLWSLLHDRQLLITFNGKSFDWPQVHDRSTLHHVGYRDLRRTDVVTEPTTDGPPIDCAEPRPGLAPVDARPEPLHLDLLHHARRRWKHQLPNCRLQTLERYICGRRRVGDLQGQAIPQAYHHYVRSGYTQEVLAILHHNALDLVTLLQLALLFLRD